MFLTYQEFLAYGGSSDVTASEFTRAEHKAEATIKLITYRRVKDETSVRECVRLCTFELMQLELGYMKADAVNPAEIGVSSQSNDIRCKKRCVPRSCKRYSLFPPRP